MEKNSLSKNLRQSLLIAPYCWLDLVPAGGPLTSLTETISSRVLAVFAFLVLLISIIAVFRSTLPSQNILATTDQAVERLSAVYITQSYNAISACQHNTGINMPSAIHNSIIIRDE